jgi:catechol-2,3-dioxygenase
MQETVDFYTKVVGLNYLAALRADHDPITGEPCDFIHTFFLLEDGSALAFFEVAGEDPQLDNPILQHFAMVVSDRDALDEVRQRLEDHGVDFVGPVDHKATLSIYFRDPTGHQLEFALPLESEVRKIQADGKWDTLKRWNGDHHPALVGAE